MKTLLILCAAVVLLAVSFCSAAGQIEAADIQLGKKGWWFGFSPTVPLFKLVEAESGTGASMDVIPMIGIGGGLSFYWGPLDDPDNARTISINFPTLVMSMREGDEEKMDLMLICDVGFLDNALRVGAGYEFGKLAYSRKRMVGVFSVGINF